MKKMLLMFVGLLAVQGVAETTITDVVARQRWPWSRLVDIDYVLTAEQGARVDIRLTAKDGATTLDLPWTSLTGDLEAVTPGLKRIVWDPTQTAYTNNLMLTQFNVTLTPTEPPLYMIVDLTKSAGAAGQIEYVTEADLTNNVWGAWVRNPVTNRGTVVEAVIWTGVAADNAYKTDKLVLRRIPAGSFYEGDDDGTKPNNITLTKEMYVGVFEVTQKQWNHVMGTTGGTDTQAKHTVSYYNIREDPNNTDDPDVNWPANKNVNANSFMGKLRTKTGLSDFDLPTEAQWEYACKAGTTTVFNDGDANAKYTGTEENNNGNTNQYLNVLGWYKFSVPTAPTAAQPVGGKRPNAWGLYDTHGNVWEYCLDWHAATAETGTDPDGPSSGSYRVGRGGRWVSDAGNCRSAHRSDISPSSRNSSIGFRAVRTLP